MSATMNEKEKNISQDIKEDEFSYSPRKRNASQVKTGKNTEKKSNKKEINKKAVIIPVVVIVVLFAAFTGYSLTLPKNKAAENVFVAGVDVGGMNTEELKSTVSGILKSDEVFTVTSGGKSSQILASDIGLEVNVEETVNNAIGVGKNSNIFKNSFDSIKLIFSKEDIPLVLVYDDEALGQVLFNFGTEINGVSTEPEYIFGENSITIKPGVSGQNHDTSVAKEEFINAVSTGEKNDIAVTLDYAQPDKLEVNAVYDELVKEPKDAAYEKTEDGKIIVTEHAVGVKLDKAKLEAAVKEVNEGKEATFDAEIVKPSKTKEDLEANLFSATLGTYTTDFSSSSSNRIHNITLASDSIDGTILMPGDTFSYNQTIGNPSLKNGYKVASVFENGKTTEGVGGGVCQVSSTLYSAVLYADLTVTERHNHSLTVAYVPRGQDATVAYGSLDFKFKNSTDYPIKVSSKVSGKKITVSLIGGKYADNRKVELSHELVSTIAPTENVTEDSTLPAGTRKVVSTGKNGYIVDTYKTVFKNGEKDSSKKITRSTYKMTPAEVLVGTGQSETAAPPAATDNVITDVGSIIDVPENQNDGSQSGSTGNSNVQSPEPQDPEAVDSSAENTGN